jgi:ribosomal protection tetracycline resistance protein
VAEKPDQAEIQIKTLETISGAKLAATDHVSSGEIGVLTNTDGLQAGDIIGVYCDGIRTAAKAEPIFTAGIAPVNRADKGRLLDALLEINLEDGQLNFTKSESQITLRLFGEIQKEFIKTQLRDKYGVETEFSETRTIFKEIPAGIGKSDTGLVAFIVEPLPQGTGVRYESNRRTGLAGITKEMRAAIEEGAFASLIPGAVIIPSSTGEGVPLPTGVHGWEVTDIRIIFDDCGGFVPASQFKIEAACAVGDAVRDAGTRILEPIYYYEIIIHAEFCSRTVNEIANYEGSVAAIEDNGAYLKLSGKLPARTSQAFMLQFQSITKNMGSFDTLRVEYEPL